MGMHTLCVTDHEDMDYNDAGEFEIDLDSYYPAMLDSRNKYKDQIDLRIGVELGIQPYLKDRLDAFVKQYPLDFVIGSTHIVNRIDPYYPEYWEGKTPKEAITEYYDATFEGIQCFSNFDVYGHIDYITRYLPDKTFDYSFPAFSDQIESILKELIHMGKGIEINTGGLYKGSDSTNPAPEILKLYRELGGEIITVGSDAHDVPYLGYGFDKAASILLDCGFSYYTIFKDRKPEFIKIK